MAYPGDAYLYNIATIGVNVDATFKKEGSTAVTTSLTDDLYEKVVPRLLRYSTSASIPVLSVL